MAFARMSKFQRNAFHLARGTAGGQMIVVAATPLLTRLYSPADFGQLAVFMSLMVLLGHISGLKFEQAIFLPKTEMGARDVTRLILVLAPGFCLITLLVLILLHLEYPARFGWYLLMVPVAIMGTTIQNIGQTWCSRQQTFTYFGTSAVINAVVNIGICLLLYWGQPSGLKLVCGYTLGIFAAAIYMVIRKWRVTARILRERWRRLHITLVTYRHFPLHVLPNALLSSFAYQAMPLLITHYFNASVTGNYAVANRLLVLPSILVGGAVSEVFRSEFVVRMHEGGAHARFFRAILIRLFIIALVAYAALWLLSPLAFSLVFGEKFSEAGAFARYLCPGVAAAFLMQPFSYVFVALRRTGEGLAMQIVLTVLPVLGFLIGAWKNSIASALLYSSAAMFIGMIFYLGLAFHFVHGKPREHVLSG